MKLKTARKEEECGICELPIPKGHKYWEAEFKDDTDIAFQHTNCADYEKPVTARGGDHDIAI